MLQALKWIPLQPSKTPDQAGLPAPMEDHAGTGMYIADAWGSHSTTGEQNALKKLQPMKSPSWSRFLTGTVAYGRATLVQSYAEKP